MFFYYFFLAETQGAGARTQTPASILGIRKYDCGVRVCARADPSVRQRAHLSEARWLSQVACVCVRVQARARARPSVCSPACLSAESCRETLPPPSSHPLLLLLPLPLHLLSPTLPRHAATETLPEIFNSVAAVNSTATLESMSHDSGKCGR